MTTRAQDDGRLARLDALLERLAPESAFIAPLHPALRNRWPDRNDSDIVARPNEWRHIVNDHARQGMTPQDVLWTLEDPDMIRRDKAYTEEKASLRVVFYRTRPDGRVTIAVVELRRGKLANQIKTAFVSTRERAFPRFATEPLLWIRDGV